MRLRVAHKHLFTGGRDSATISVGSFVRKPVRINESLGRTNRTGLFLSFVSFTIRFTGNSTERTNEFPVALTPLSLTDSAENRAMACIP